MMRGRPIIVALCLVIAGSVCADEPRTERAEFSSSRLFRLPMTPIDPLQRQRLREVLLYTSNDRGASWRHYDSARPEQQSFVFEAPTDGEYWFALATIDQEGRMQPPSMVGVAPEMRVIVDTIAPDVRLRAGRSKAGSLAVDWQILDQDADLRSFRLEFRASGSDRWQAIAVLPSLNGRADWNPEFAGPIEARLRIQDRAGNPGSDSIAMSGREGIRAGARARPAIGTKGIDPSGAALPARNRTGDESVEADQFVLPRRPAVDRAPDSPWEDRFASGATASTSRDRANSRPESTRLPYVPRDRRGRLNPLEGDSTVKQPASKAPTNAKDSPVRRLLVKSRTFEIAYEAEGVGRSGLDSVILYYWDWESGTWLQYGVDEDGKSPFLVRTDDEGIFDLILVARSGAGFGDDPPTPGDLPQIRVEVDETPPVVRLDRPVPGEGPAEGTLAITWQADDLNLAPRPISILYAESANGPWEKIATGIANTGSFKWRMQKDVPFKFHVRIEALDRASNTGRAETATPVIVDLSRPRINVLDVSAHDDLSQPDDAEPSHSEPVSGEDQIDGERETSPVLPDQTGP